MNVNVKIPLSLFNQVFYILENININSYCDTFQIEYFDLIDALHRKKEALELRQTYTDILRAKDEDSRLFAKLRYLQQKSLFYNEGL